MSVTTEGLGGCLRTARAQQWKLSLQQNLNSQVKLKCAQSRGQNSGTATVIPTRNAAHKPGPLWQGEVKLQTHTLPQTPAWEMLLQTTGGVFACLFLCKR